MDNNSSTFDLEKVSEINLIDVFLKSLGCAELNLANLNIKGKFYASNLF